jgi:hypothetical protein
LARRWCANKKDPSLWKGPSWSNREKKVALVGGWRKGVGMRQERDRQSVRALDAVALAPDYARRTRSIVVPPNHIAPIRNARSALLLCVGRAVGPIKRDGSSLCEKDGGEE